MNAETEKHLNRRASDTVVKALWQQLNLARTIAENSVAGAWDPTLIELCHQVMDYLEQAHLKAEALWRQFGNKLPWE